MTPELSLFFIAWRAGSRAESTSLTFGAAANAERSWADAGEASWSTQATVMRVVAAGEDRPEQDDEDEREGERPEQRLAVAQVAPDVGDGQGPKRLHRTPPSVPQRPAGQLEEDVLEGGLADAEVARLDAHAPRSGRAARRSSPGRRACRANVVSVVVLDRGHRRPAAASSPSSSSGERVEADRPLVEASVDELARAYPSRGSGRGP